MFRKIALLKNIANPSYIYTRSHQVTVVGGATDIGQTICLLLRAQPNITKLVLHDTQQQTQGVILDLSHVPTNASVRGYVGEDTLASALENAEIVIGAGGMIHKPGITDNVWLATNSGYIQYLAKSISRLKKLPFFGIVTNPINNLIPMAAEVMRNYGEYDPKKLFGITYIDTLRAQTLYAAERKLDPRTIFIPVIGGHSSTTSIPLLSQVQPTSEMNEAQVREFTTKFRNIQDRIINAKKGYSPVLSIAFSALLFTRSVLAALDGKPATVNAYIENNDFGTEYFSGLVHLNQDGVKEMQMYPDLSKYECHLLEMSIEQIRKDVMQGKKILESA